MDAASCPPRTGLSGHDLKAYFYAWTNKHFEVSRYLVAYLLAISLLLSLWHWRATGEISFKALPAFLCMCAVSFIYGHVFTKHIPSAFRTSAGLSIQFLCGYLVCSTVLLLLSLFTPFGIVTNVLILVGGSVLILLSCSRAAKDIRKPADYLPDFLCLLLSGLAATLWCTDLFSGVMTDGENMVYPIYIDGFYHVRQISSFAQTHGLRTMSDMRMSGAPARLYHYAIYVIPAALSVFTTSDAYTMFVSFLVPFGIFLTGLAAFSLAGFVWGPWPGLAATVAVCLLPDAYQQGSGNKWLSYNFFQQAAPGGSYGVACVAIAWIFMLDGCKRAKLSSVAMSYTVLLICIAYKAQFFVANAFLLMIYPCAYFRGLRIRWRIVGALLLTSLFASVVSFSQQLRGMPTLRLDGSGAIFYTRFLILASDPGIFKSFFSTAFAPLWKSNAHLLLDLSLPGFLVLFTFGLWTFGLVVPLLVGKKRIGPAAFFFPFLVVINYLVMSLGLAMDAKGAGRPEELLHRPFVWAYFVVVAWTGAAIYTYLIGNHPPRSKVEGISAVLLALGSLSVPLVYARDIQTFPAFKGMASYRTFNSIPSGLIQACLYIRTHSEIKDIIQDSENDPRWVITALAERQCFVAYDAEKTRSFTTRPPEGLAERLKQLAACKEMKDETSVVAFMQKHGISWYILRPESNIGWPRSVLDKPVFRSGDYRIYHFIP